MSDHDEPNAPILELPTTLEELESLYTKAANAKDLELCLMIYKKVRIMQLRHHDLLTNHQLYVWEERRKLIKAAPPKDDQWKVYTLGA